MIAIGKKLQLLGGSWADYGGYLKQYSIGTMVDKVNHTVFGQTLMNHTVQFEWDLIFIAAGALTGLRVCASMFVSATLCWAVFVPILQSHHLISETARYEGIVEWTLWGGVSCMVTASLLSFAMQWKSIVRAFRSLARIFTVFGSNTPARTEMDALETPMSWFLLGQIVSLVALSLLAKYTFNMPYWQSALAVLLSFFLALVACRVTGETDQTPVGAMGKVTQLIFGAISPGEAMLHTNVNLMAANITAGAATSSADLLTDLKSGYLLGANPRKQFLAQFAGIFVGTVVTVLCFKIMVPNETFLGGDQFPAPAAQAWKAVAEVMSKGIENLAPVKRWSLLVGAIVGILLSLSSKLFPKCEKWMPSPAGVGLAWTFHWFFSLLFFVGALAAYGFEKKEPEKSAEFLFPVASGIVAGGSLMGVLLIFFDNGPQMFSQMIDAIQQLIHK